MARTKFTFTFSHAQPGANVSFNYPVYADGETKQQDGPSLVLDANNSVAVWAETDSLVANTVDGNGLPINATATLASPSVTVSDGTAGQSPFGNGTSLPDQTGQSGKVLGTDGTNPEWVSGGSSAAPPLPFISVTPAAVGDVTVLNSYLIASIDLYDEAGNDTTVTAPGVLPAPFDWAWWGSDNKLYLKSNIAAQFDVSAATGGGNEWAAFVGTGSLGVSQHLVGLPGAGTPGAGFQIASYGVPTAWESGGPDGEPGWDRLTWEFQRTAGTITALGALGVTKIA